MIFAHISDLMQPRKGKVLHKLQCEAVRYGTYEGTHGVYKGGYLQNDGSMQCSGQYVVERQDTSRIRKQVFNSFFFLLSYATHDLWLVQFFFYLTYRSNG